MITNNNSTDSLLRKSIESINLNSASVKSSFLKTHFKFNILIVFVLCAFLILQGCTKSDSINSNDHAKFRNSANIMDPNDSIDSDIIKDMDSYALEDMVTNNQENLAASFTIGMIGDVLFHEWLINGGLQSNGTYSFPYIYEYLEQDINNLNFAMFNMEGTLAGPPYSGYPLFSAPAALADSMAEKGFDLATTANNHSVDRGIKGMNSTIDNIRNAGLENLGTRKENDPPYFSTEINGIKVAISTATYTTAKVNGMISLNGIPIPVESEHLIDTFSLEEQFMANDIAIIQERARTMREDGNEVIIFIMHWGTEYSLQEDWFQQVYAQALADAGVDMVFGMHPHVIEPIKTVRSEDGKHNMLVYYSLGNSVSDQDYWTADMAGHCQDGLMGIVTFERNKYGEIKIRTAGYMATYCHMIKIAHDATQSQVIPVQRALENPETYGIHDYELIRDSYNRTANIMKNNKIEGIEFREYDSVPIFNFVSLE